MIDLSALSSAAPTPKGLGPAPVGQGGGSSDFENLVAGLASGTAASLRAGERAAIEGIAGKLPLQEVVGAVMAAERSLSMALAIRDKSVAAFNEISRMAI